MSTAEALALWAAVASYVLSLTLLLASAVFEKERLRAVGHGIAGAALAFHAAAIAVRWAATGHGPVMGAYEHALAGALFVPVIFAAIAWRSPAVRRAAPLVLAATLLLLGNGIMAREGGAPLEPPFRSNWLVVHVVFAWFAFGSYLVASVTAGYYLWVTRAGRPAPVPDRRPVIDELSLKLITFGFVTDSIMIASGAIWAHGLWGRYWAWDPIETWSLVSWLIYGVNLHLRFTLGWKGRRAAWVAMLSVLGVIVTFFGIGVISDVHTGLL